MCVRVCVSVCVCVCVCVSLCVCLCVCLCLQYPNTSVFEIHHSGNAQLKMYVSGQEQGFQTAGDNSSGRVSFTDPANDSASVEIVFSPAVTVKVGLDNVLVLL